MNEHAGENRAHDPWARVGKALASGNRTRREDVEPPNHRSVEVTHTHYGERIRCYMEIVKPGGKSSREIRADLEAEIATLRKGDAA